MTGTRVPRDPNITPEMRRFLDDLARVSNIFDGMTAAEATAALNVFTDTLKGLVFELSISDPIVRALVLSDVELRPLKR